MLFVLWSKWCVLSAAVCLWQPVGEPVCRGPWERWGEARRSAGSWDILSWMEDQPVLGFENTE